MVTAKGWGSCLHVVFVFRLHACARGVPLHMHAHTCLYIQGLAIPEKYPFQMFCLFQCPH